jgi:hypothetical protein
VKTEIFSDMVWSAAAACAGSYADSPVFRPVDAQRALNSARPMPQLADSGSRLRGMRRIQAVQGRNVSSETGSVAPTAHKAATEGGVSGPYPWRHPA